MMMIIGGSLIAFIMVVMTVMTTGMVMMPTPQAVAETLVDRRAEILTELMRPTLWAFNYRMGNELPGLVYQAAKTLRLM
jgi:hypothetical protein